MEIIVNGAGGRMGNEVVKMAQSGVRGAKLAAAVDINGCSVSGCPVAKYLEEYEGAADCIVDFSHHSVTGRLMQYAKSRSLPVVVATTGHTEEELEQIRQAAKEIPVFLSANMSLGVAVLADLAEKAARMFPDADIEIVEKHHNRKLDVPSGTALLLADRIKKARPDAEYVIGRHENGKRTKKEIGIHSLRMGNVVGEHEIIISTDTQILTLKHEAQSRALFAEGALCAADFLVKQEPGLYSMEDMLAVE